MTKNTGARPAGEGLPIGTLPGDHVRKVGDKSVPDPTRRMAGATLGGQVFPVVEVVDLLIGFQWVIGGSDKNGDTNLYHCYVAMDTNA